MYIASILLVCMVSKLFTRKMATSFVLVLTISVSHLDGSTAILRVKLHRVGLRLLSIEIARFVVTRRSSLSNCTGSWSSQQCGPANAANSR